MSDIIDWDDLSNVCRDDVCENDELHTSHIIFLKQERKHRLLRSSLALQAVAYDQIESRRLRPFHAIYEDMQTYYGAIHVRSAYRAVAALVEQRLVARVVSRTNRGRFGDLTHGGFIRYDSEYIWRPDGRTWLLEQFDDEFDDVDADDY